MSKFQRILAWTALAGLFLGGFFVWLNKPSDKQPEYGVTYSIIHAKRLGLDWQEAYTAIIEDLEVERVRLPVYWSEVEYEKDTLFWEEWDWMVEQAEEHDVALTMVVGAKVPRWPECFIPDWAEQIDDPYQHQQLTEFVADVVKRYDDSPSVVRWQVENEPFFSFGECPTPKPNRVFEEVALVRSLSDKSVQMTVSGELETWYDAATMADIVGISMYRVTWNQLFGYFYYPVTPGFYKFHAAVVSPFVDKVVVSELQAEPWFPEPVEARTPEQWYETFNADMMRQNIAFANRTGLPEVYLWGAEWWYYLKVNGQPQLWNVARELFP